MKVYGYCRISTGKQNIDRQVRNILAKYPSAEIVKETFTGTKKTGRKGLEKIIHKAVSGDTIVFDSVSRMSRNADEGIQLYMELYSKDITLVFLKEPHINTATYSKALNGAEQLGDTGNAIADEYINATRKVLKLLAMEQIRLAFEQSQKEVDDLHQRTKEGIEMAKKQGKQIGQVKGRKLNVKKAVKAKEIIKKHCREFGGSLTDVECLPLTKVSRNTFYKYKRELLKELEEK